MQNFFFLAVFFLVEKKGPRKEEEEEERTREKNNIGIGDGELHVQVSQLDLQDVFLSVHVPDLQVAVDLL